MSEQTQAEKTQKEADRLPDELTVEEKVQDLKPAIENHEDTLHDADNPGGLPPSGGTTTDGGAG